VTSSDISRIRFMAQPRLAEADGSEREDCGTTDRLVGVKKMLKLNRYISQYHPSRRALWILSLSFRSRPVNC